jgi:hypothetical protein
MLDHGVQHDAGGEPAEESDQHASLGRREHGEPDRERRGIGSASIGY